MLVVQSEEAEWIRRRNALSILYYILGRYTNRKAQQAFQTWKTKVQPIQTCHDFATFNPSTIMQSSEVSYGNMKNTPHTTDFNRQKRDHSNTVTGKRAKSTNLHHLPSMEMISMESIRHSRDETSDSIPHSAHQYSSLELPSQSVIDQQRNAVLNETPPHLSSSLSTIENDFCENFSAKEARRLYSAKMDYSCREDNLYRELEQSPNSHSNQQLPLEIGIQLSEPLSHNIQTHELDSSAHTNRKSENPIELEAGRDSLVDLSRFPTVYVPHKQDSAQISVAQQKFLPKSTSFSQTEHKSEQSSHSINPQSNFSLRGFKPSQNAYSNDQFSSSRKKMSQIVYATNASAIHTTSPDHIQQMSQNQTNFSLPKHSSMHIDHFNQNSSDFRNQIDRNSCVAQESTPSNSNLQSVYTQSSPLNTSKASKKDTIAYGTHSIIIQRLQQASDPNKGTDIDQTNLASPDHTHILYPEENEVLFSFDPQVISTFEIDAKMQSKGIIDNSPDKTEEQTEIDDKIRSEVERSNQLVSAKEEEIRQLSVKLTQV